MSNQLHCYICHHKQESNEIICDVCGLSCEICFPAEQRVFSKFQKFLLFFTGFAFLYTMIKWIL